MGGYFTHVSDEWALSDGISQNNTDIEINSIGASLIARYYPTDSIWVKGFVGLNYNYINIDQQEIGGNASKIFDNNGNRGKHVGLGVGIRFENSFWDATWEFVLEFRYTFLSIDAVETGKVFGTQIEKKTSESHDFGVILLGFNLCF